MGRTSFATLMLCAALASALVGYSGSASLQQPTPSLMPLPLPLPPPQRPQPLCASQFALVNHACSMIMPKPAPPPAPPSPPLTPPGPLPPPPCPDDESQRGHGHGHGHHNRTCQEHRRGHGHHHRHQHGRHGDEPSPAEQDCCKWLKEVDSECVCDLLVRLPSFLTRPIHVYTVTVPDLCNVTFFCGGRLHP
ncbi:proline-rich protein 13 [Eucalyptus grandis]|uniref:proline-rich protein 13 n=1 Tax=Eucalyptus grandis TaxID=71139 RepID=UPI00192EA66A|nr:proline-rich protein 13 [Eucalyptus grandis]